MARPLNFEVNTSGAWRRVAELDLDRYAEGELLTLVSQLLQGATFERVTARLVIPGDTAPLWHWSKSAGWVQWKGPAA